VRFTVGDVGTVHLNDEEILGAMVEPFMQANEILGRAFQARFDMWIWTWPGMTQRRAGAPVGSPRNIVDLGHLRDSYEFARIPHAPGGPEYEHGWAAEYAMAVHEGARKRNGQTMPGRPWTLDPLENGVLENAFIKLAMAALERIREPRL